MTEMDKLEVVDQARKNLLIRFHRTRLTPDVMVDMNDLSVVLDFLAALRQPDTPADPRPDPREEALREAQEMCRQIAPLLDAPLAALRQMAERVREMEAFREAVEHGYQVNHTSKWCRDQAAILTETGGENA